MEVDRARGKASPGATALGPTHQRLWKCMRQCPCSEHAPSHDISCWHAADIPLLACRSAWRRCWPNL